MLPTPETPNSLWYKSPQATREIQTKSEAWEAHRGVHLIRPDKTGRSTRAAPEVSDFTVPSRDGQMPRGAHKTGLGVRWTKRGREDVWTFGPGDAK